MLPLVFITSFLGGFVPVVNADAVLIGAALLAPPGSALMLIVVAAIAQVAGKVVFFGITACAGETALRLLGRHADRVRGASNTRGASAGVFLSAAVGLPPLFITTFAAATARMPLLRFCAAALCGRALRITVLVLSPHLITGLLS
jgi:membrane protein YqaA with SNARE-associated domain